MRIEDDNTTIDQLKIRREDDAHLSSSNLILTKVIVKIRYEIGDEIEEDTSCDLKYMIPAKDYGG